MLSQDLARTIVKKLMSVLGKNINIMDNRGVIIASGDPARVGTFHAGAAQAVRDAKPFIIHSDDLESMSGVKPGINIPITFGKEIIGVVGITGDPEEVRDFGELVRYTVELMVEESALREQVYLQERARDIYYQDLLSGNWADEQAFVARGKLLGIDLGIPRVAVLVEFDHPENLADTELAAAQAMRNVIEALKNHFGRQQAVLGFSGAFRLLLFTAVKQDADIDKQRKAAALKTTEIVAGLVKQKFRVSVGHYYPGLGGLLASYAESREAVMLGRLFYPNKQIYLPEEQRIFTMVDMVPPERRRGYYKAVLGPLVDGKEDRDYMEQLFVTLRAYLENNLNAYETAKVLFVHRNTLAHRLKKITMLTGLNPSIFQDAFKLNLAILFYILDKE